MNTDSQAPEQPAPYVIRRDRFAQAAPHIEGVLQDFLAFIEEQGGEMPACPGVTVSSEDVRPLLAQHLSLAGIGQERVSAHTLMLYLPISLVVGLITMAATKNADRKSNA